MIFRRHLTEILRMANTLTLLLTHIGAVSECIRTKARVKYSAAWMSPEVRKSNKGRKEQCSI